MLFLCGLCTIFSSCVAVHFQDCFNIVVLCKIMHCEEFDTDPELSFYFLRCSLPTCPSRAPTALRDPTGTRHLLTGPLLGMFLVKNSWKAITKGTSIKWRLVAIHWYSLKIFLIGVAYNRHVFLHAYWSWCCEWFPQYVEAAFQPNPQTDLITDM